MKRNPLAQKHSVSVPILKSLKIRKPENYQALLMPGETGPERHILPAMGVKLQNMFCVERSRKQWQYLKDCGFRVGLSPLDAVDAIPNVAGDACSPMDLVYLDFMAQIGIDEYKAVSSLFSYKLIKRGTKLLLTFGKNRTTKEKVIFSRIFGYGWKKPYPPVLPFLDDIIRSGNYRNYKRVVEHPYVSDKWHYVTLECDF